MKRIFCALFVLFAPLSVTFAQEFPACPDESYFTVTGENGLNYGWFQDATCVVDDIPAEGEVVVFPACPDASFFTIAGGNGINYGWYQDATCIVEDAPAVEEVVEFPLCPDDSFFTSFGDNGLSYGWYQDATCVIDAPPISTGEIQPDSSDPTSPTLVDPELVALEGFYQVAETTVVFIEPDGRMTFFTFNEVFSAFSGDIQTFCWSVSSVASLTNFGDGVFEEVGVSFGDPYTVTWMLDPETGNLNSFAGDAMFSIFPIEDPDNFNSCNIAET